jgi:hypothetical protein
MKRRVYALKEVQRMVPLLRSIGREIHSRRHSAEEIGKHLESLRSRSHPSPDLSHLEAQLSTHRREIHAAVRELEHLGCRLDEQHPPRILIPSPNGHWAFDGHLDDTRFYAAPAAGAP